MIKIKEIEIFCVDGTVHEEFNKAYIYTIKYKTRLVRDSIHAPRAAKIIAKSNNINTMFLLISPVISVDYRGYVSVYTSSSVEEVTLQKPIEFSASGYKNSKVNDKLFKAKIALGLSYGEIVHKTNNEIEMEVQQLVKGLPLYAEGGGFNE